MQVKLHCMPMSSHNLKSMGEMTKICGTCGLMGEMHDRIIQYQRLLQICQKHNLLPA